MGRLLREFHGSNVIKSVHIEAAWSGPDPVDETRYLAGVTAEHGFPHAYVVLADMVGGTRGRSWTPTSPPSPLVRGVRIREHPEGDDPTFLANLRACAERDLHFETRAWPGPPAALPRVRAAVPEATFVVGASGMPMSDSRRGVRRTGAGSWRRSRSCPTSTARWAAWAWSSTTGRWTRSGPGCSR